MAADAVIKIDTSFNTEDFEIGMRSFQDSVTGSVNIILDSFKNITTVVNGCDAVNTAFEFLKDNFASIGELLPALIANFSELIASIAAVAGPVAIVAAAIAGLALMFQHLWETNEEFRANITASWESVCATFEAVKEIFNGFVQELTDSGTMKSMVDAFVGVWEPVEEIFAVLFETIAMIFARFFEGITAFLDAHGEEIQSKLVFAWQTAWSVLEPLVKMIGEVISALAVIVRETVALIVAIVDGDWSSAWESAKAIVQGAVDLVLSIFDGFRTALHNSFTGLMNVILEIWDTIKTRISEKAREIYDNVMAVMNLLPGELRDIGVNMVQGLVDGFFSMLNWALEQVGGFVDSIMGRITGASGFDVHSPSKWASQVGAHVVEGLANGIGGSAETVTDAARKMIDELKSKMEAWAEDLQNVQLVAIETMVKQILNQKYTAEAFYSGGIDLDAQGKSQEEAINLRNEYFNADLSLQQKSQETAISSKSVFFKKENEISAIHYEEMYKAKQEATAREYTLMEYASVNMLNMLRSYTPQWYDVGMTLMNNLIAGMQAYMGELQSVVSRIQSMLNSIAIDSMSIPVYGTGGIVTQPHLAVVGDVPEAIIPLNKLYDVVVGTVSMMPVVETSGRTYYDSSDKKEIKQNVVININQPVKSPAEMAREIKRISRALADGL